MLIATLTAQGEKDTDKGDIVKINLLATGLAAAAMLAMVSVGHAQVSGSSSTGGIFSPNPERGVNATSRRVGSGNFQVSQQDNTYRNSGEFVLPSSTTVRSGNYSRTTTSGTDGTGGGDWNARAGGAGSPPADWNTSHGANTSAYPGGYHGRTGPGIGGAGSGAAGGTSLGRSGRSSGTAGAPWGSSGGSGGGK